MSVLCVCIQGFYNTTLESEDTHATSTVRIVLQFVEEHFMVAHTLFKPQQYKTTRTSKCKDTKTG